MNWSDPVTADLIIGFFIGCAFMALMMWRKRIIEKAEFASAEAGEA